METGNNKLTVAEVRSLVDAYFATRESGAELAKGAGAAASQTFRCLTGWHAAMEEEISRALEVWTEDIPAARWAKSVAIVPAMAAGLAAHIDIARCPTVGRIWRFAGLDPTREREPGKPRPWNPSLKMLCWRIGESFANSSGTDGDFYGGLYLRRKLRENAANDAGEFAGQAAAKLRDRQSAADVEASKWHILGKLPPSHIEARARRWVVKLFLAHYHHVAWTVATGGPPPKPYVIGVLGHADYIAPPNFIGGEL